MSTDQQYTDKNGKPLNVFLNFKKNHYQSFKTQNPNLQKKELTQAFTALYYRSVNKQMPTQHANKSRCRRLSEEDCQINKEMCKWSVPKNHLKKPHCIGQRVEDPENKAFGHMKIKQGPVIKNPKHRLSSGPKYSDVID